MNFTTVILCFSQRVMINNFPDFYSFKVDFKLKPFSPKTVTQLYQILKNNGFLRDKMFISLTSGTFWIEYTTLTSNSALMSFALRLKAGPTAWKFLSRNSPNSSSDELSITFFGSDGMSATEDGAPFAPVDDAKNFSGGSLTVAINQMTKNLTAKKKIVCLLPMRFRLVSTDCLSSTHLPHIIC